MCAPAHRDPAFAFDAMASADNPSVQRPMFIVDWARFVTTANQQDLDERGHLTNLERQSEQPNSHCGSALNASTGLLVIITPTLGTLLHAFTTKMIAFELKHSNT